MRISDWSSDVCSSDLQSDFDAVLADRFGNAVGGESWHEDVAARLRGRGISLREIAEVEHRRGVEVAMMARALHLHRDAGRPGPERQSAVHDAFGIDRKSTRLNSSH